MLFSLCGSEQDYDKHESMEYKPQKKAFFKLKDCIELFTTKEKLGAEDPWWEETPKHVTYKSCNLNLYAVCNSNQVNLLWWRSRTKHNPGIFCILSVCPVTSFLSHFHTCQQTTSYPWTSPLHTIFPPISFCWWLIEAYKDDFNLIVFNLLKVVLAFWIVNVFCTQKKYSEMNKWIGGKNK